MEIRCAHCLKLLLVVDGEIIRCSDHPNGAYQLIQINPNESKVAETVNGV